MGNMFLSPPYRFTYRLFPQKELLGEMEITLDPTRDGALDFNASRTCNLVNSFFGHGVFFNKQNFL